MPILGVNIDHVATVRQARQTNEPDPVWAATQRAYTPGLVTAVLLLPLAIWLATRLVSEQPDAT